MCERMSGRVRAQEKVAGSAGFVTSQVLNASLFSQNYLKERKGKWHASLFPQTAECVHGLRSFLHNQAKLDNVIIYCGGSLLVALLLVIFTCR